MRYKTQPIKTNTSVRGCVDYSMYLNTMNRSVTDIVINIRMKARTPLRKEDIYFYIMNKEVSGVVI